MSDSAAATAAPMVPGLLPSLIDEAVRRFPHRLAIDFLGRSMTYRELGQYVDHVAAGLQRVGVSKGMRVGLFLPNTPYMVIAYFAILKAGGVVVNFNPLYVEREVRHQVQDSGTRIMFVLDIDDHYRKVAAQLGPDGLQHIVVCSLAAAMPTLKGLAYSLIYRKTRAHPPKDARHSTFAALAATREALRPVDIEIGAPAVLQYTGGTTGVPKAATLTHANLTIQTQQVLRWLAPLMTDEQQRLIGLLPLFHVFAMTSVMLTSVVIGGEMILLPRLDLKVLMKTIARCKPTCVPGVPTLYTAIANAAEKESMDLSSIRICISGGAPLPDEVRRRFEKLTGCVLVEGYGLSETSPVLTVNPAGAAGKPGSVGLPVEGTTIEIRSIEDPKKILPQGETGEVCARGPQVMTGYWNQPDETARVMVDGAFRTGDVGYLDADGYLFLVDRLKDMIICSGFNVYPRVIEEALYRHPAVAEAAVIGVPDDYRGEAPKAFVQLRAGMSCTAEEILAFLKDQVSRIEMPREVEFKDALPKSAVGKILRRELAAEEKRRRQAETGKAA